MSCSKRLPAFGPAYMLVLVLFLTVGSIWSQGVPLWLTDLGSVYPEEKFIAVQGSGVDISAARNDGLVQLARFFGTSIEALSEGSQVYKDSSTGSNLDIKIAETVKIRTSSDLFAVRYSGTYQKNATSYVVAYINRAEVGDNLSDAAKDAGKRIRDLLEATKHSEDAASKLARAAGANVLASQANVILKKLSLVDRDRARDLKVQIPIDEAQDSWEKVRRDVRIALKIEGDGDGVLTGKIRSLLSAEGLIVDSKGILTLAGKADFKEVTISPPFKTVTWTYDLDLVDDTGGSLVSAHKTGRASGTSYDSAKTQSILAFEAFASNEFLTAVREQMVAKIY